MHTWRRFILEIVSTADDLGLHSEVAVATHASRIVGLDSCGILKAEHFLGIETRPLLWAAGMRTSVMTMFSSVQNGPNLCGNIIVGNTGLQYDHSYMLVACLHVLSKEPRKDQNVQLGIHHTGFLLIFRKLLDVENIVRGRYCCRTYFP